MPFSTQQSYQPLHWRMAAVGITTYANYIVMFLPLLGLFTGLIQPLTGVLIMAIAWGVIMLFNLITLPVEFDASRRARAVLADTGMIAPGEETLAVRRVLDSGGLDLRGRLHHVPGLLSVVFAAPAGRRTFPVSAAPP